MKPTQSEKKGPPNKGYLLAGGCWPKKGCLDMNEYKGKCSLCGEKRKSRIFYRKIDAAWKYLCTGCWENQQKIDRPRAIFPKQKTWDDIFRAAIQRGDDPGYAGWLADQWEKRKLAAAVKAVR